MRFLWYTLIPAVIFATSNDGTQEPKECENTATQEQNNLPALPPQPPAHPPNIVLDEVSQAQQIQSAEEESVEDFWDYEELHEEGEIEGADFTNNEYEADLTPPASDDDDLWVEDEPPVFFTAEHALNDLLDNQCEISRFVGILGIALSRGDLEVFRTACVACYQQYNPDAPELQQILEMTIVLGQPAYFEALIQGQCGQNAFGTKVLSLLHILPHNFLEPALRQCGSIIPRHAIDAWKGENDPKEGNVQVEWSNIGGVTADLHTYISWPYKVEEKGEAKVVGLIASYSSAGEGKMEILHDGLGSLEGKLLVKTENGSITNVALTNGAASNPYAILTADSPTALHNAINDEVYKGSNRFRAASVILKRLPESSAGVFTLNAEWLNDGGPLVLVYRSGDILIPKGMQKHDETAESANESTVWAQPAPRLFLPYAFSAELQLERGDVILLAPPELQLAISELDLRGLMYAADGESLPEIVGDLLRTLHIKTEKPLYIAAMIII